MIVFLNGRFLPASRARISVFDHGFLYGDGIYETVRAYDYRIFHWTTHYRRLKQSAMPLALKIPWSSASLEKSILRLLRMNHSPNGSVRITVARGAGPLGLDPALCPKPTLAMMLHPARDLGHAQRVGVSVGISRVRRNHPLCLDPQLKSNNSINTILARMEAKRMGVFEAVLLNLDGHLTEGTTTNLFWTRRKRLFTPALSCGLLKGVTRGVVIQRARRAGWEVEEGRYATAMLRQADEIFLTSTTLEVVPVIRVVSAVPGPLIWRGQPGPLARRLQSSFRSFSRRSKRKP